SVCCGQTLGPRLGPSGGPVEGLQTRKLRRINNSGDGNEPGGRRFESCRARHLIPAYSEWMRSTSFRADGYHFPPEPEALAHLRPADTLSGERVTEVDQPAVRRCRLWTHRLSGGPASRNGS